MKMKTFKELLNESVSAWETKVGNAYEQNLLPKNENRIGKTVIDAKGNEIPKSVWIDERSYMIDKGNKVELVTYNSIDQRTITLSFTKDSAKRIKSFL